MAAKSASQLTFDLSPRGQLPCPTRGFKPKSQSGWWVIAASECSVLQFVRLPPETRNANLVFQAEGDWAVKVLAPTPHSARSLFSPIAVNDGRTLPGESQYHVDLLPALLGRRFSSEETSTRDTAVPRCGILGDPCLFVLLTKAGMGKAPAIFKSVRVQVMAHKATLYEVAPSTEESIEFIPPLDEGRLTDAAPFAQEITGCEALPESIEVRGRRRTCLQGGRKILPFARDEHDIPLNDQRIGALTLATLGQKLALDAMPGRIEVHYADGTLALAPLSEGVNCGNAVREKWLKGAEAMTGVHGPSHLSAARLAWMVPTARGREATTINLPYAGAYVSDWINPRPGAPVRSLRFISARGRSELYVLGLWARPPGCRVGLAASNLTARAGEETLVAWIYGINERLEVSAIESVLRLIGADGEQARQRVSLVVPGQSGSAEMIQFNTASLPTGVYRLVLENADGAVLDTPIDVGVVAGETGRKGSHRRATVETTLPLAEVNGETLMRLHNEGVNVVCVRIPWRTLEPKRGQYSYSVLDQLLTLAHKVNMPLRLTLDHSQPRACPVWLELKGRDEEGRPSRRPSLWDGEFVSSLQKAWQSLARACRQEPLVIGWRLTLVHDRWVWAHWPGRCEGYEPEAATAFVEWARGSGYRLKDLAEWSNDSLRSWQNIRLPRPGDSPSFDKLIEQFIRFRSETAAHVRRALYQTIAAENPQKDIAYLCDMGSGYTWGGLCESLPSLADHLKSANAAWRFTSPEAHGRADLFGRRFAFGDNPLAAEIVENLPVAATMSEALGRLVTLGGQSLTFPSDPLVLNGVGALGTERVALERMVGARAVPATIGLFVTGWSHALKRESADDPQSAAARLRAAHAARLTRLNVGHRVVFDFDLPEAIDSQIKILIDAGNPRYDDDVLNAIERFVKTGGWYIAMGPASSSDGYALHQRFGIQVAEISAEQYVVINTAPGERATAMLTGKGACLRLDGPPPFFEYHTLSGQAFGGAATRRSVGAGGFIALGFPWLPTGPAGFRAFLLDCLKQAGGRPAYEIDNLFVESGLYRTDDGRRLLPVWNGSAEAQSIRATLHLPQAVSPPIVRESLRKIDTQTQWNGPLSTLALLSRLPARSLGIFEITS